MNTKVSKPVFTARMFKQPDGVYTSEIDGLDYNDGASYVAFAEACEQIAWRAREASARFPEGAEWVERQIVDADGHVLETLRFQKRAKSRLGWDKELEQAHANLIEEHLAALEKIKMLEEGL